jgi:hypothetical protein
MTVHCVRDNNPSVKLQLADDGSVAVLYNTHETVPQKYTTATHDGTDCRVVRLLDSKTTKLM